VKNYREQWLVVNQQKAWESLGINLAFFSYNIFSWMKTVLLNEANSLTSEVEYDGIVGKGWPQGPSL